MNREALPCCALSCLGRGLPCFLNAAKRCDDQERPNHLLAYAMMIARYDVPTIPEGVLGASDPTFEVL